MKGTVFYKMSGSGNDFVFLDARYTPEASCTAEAVSAICERRKGVGADGVVLLGRGRGSKKGRVSFVFFNSDGSRAPMCGNAALCATRLAVRLELTPGPDMVLETESGDLRSRSLDGPDERAQLFLEDFQANTAVSVEKRGGESGIWSLTVGVPHVVVEVESLEGDELMERGRKLRFHEAFEPGGANVNFVSQGRGRGRRPGEWMMRSYERGVEGETMACGTGAVACAAILANKGVVTLPWEVKTVSGSVLRVEGKPIGDGSGSVGLENPSLIGEARLVMTGILA
ncbi:MAG: diaminopimelate epimerase [Gemmatimonadetes bacterium]|nr:diaminopimelate epimerase [Gemmatimonadota bacterium]